MSWRRFRLIAAPALAVLLFYGNAFRVGCYEVGDHVFTAEAGQTSLGDGETAPAADSTNGSEAVWQDYDLVIHGNDPETDVTGNHGTITSTGGVLLSGANLLNGWPAYAYGASQGTATTDNIKITSATNSAVKTEMTFAYKDGTEDSTAGRLAAWETGNEYHRKADVDDLEINRKRSTTNQFTQATAGEIIDDAWHMFGFTFNGTTSAVDIRLNKTNPTLTQQSGSGTLTPGSGTKTLMNRHDNGRAFTGRFVEHRQRPDTTPDDTWMDLEDDTFRDPGAIAEAEALAVV